MISVVVGLTIAAAGVGAVVLARHRAQAAADLSALAAADAVPGGRDIACRRAEQIVASTGASLTQCRIEGLDVVVTVDVPVALRIPGLSAPASARSSARAGPIE